MKNILRTLAIIVLASVLYSCQPAKTDFEAREAKISKEIEKMNVQSVYMDIMMLYFDVIEDVYNEGKESGEFDLKRLEDFESGLISDFREKIDINSSDFWTEADDRYDESLVDRMETLRPMMEEMFGDVYSEADDEAEAPTMLPDSSFVIGKDTLKELENGDIIFNHDTLTYEEFMQRIGANE